MKKYKIILISLFFCVFAYGQIFSQDFPANISIEVEFKEAKHGEIGLKGLGRVQRRHKSSYTKQFIVVSDGLTGSIRVGQDVPFINYYINYLRHHGYIVSEETIFKEVGTSLKVTPKIRGRLIEIQLVPAISAITDEKKQIIDIKELSTSVMVADGQSISIGGLIKDEEFSGIFLKSSESESFDVILTPRIRK